MTAYLICPVRELDKATSRAIMRFILKLEDEYGWDVHVPFRDTTQDKGELQACEENLAATVESEAVIIWYDDSSGGSRIDIGFAMAHDKPIIPVNVEAMEDIVENSKGMKTFAGLVLSLAELSYDGNETAFAQVTKAYNESIEGTQLNDEEGPV